MLFLAAYLSDIFQEVQEDSYFAVSKFPERVSIGRLLFEVLITKLKQYN